MLGLRRAAEIRQVAATHVHPQQGWHIAQGREDTLNTIVSLFPERATPASPRPSCCLARKWTCSGGRRATLRGQLRSSCRTSRPISDRTVSTGTGPIIDCPNWQTTCWLEASPRRIALSISPFRRVFEKLTFFKLTAAEKNSFTV